MYEMICHLVAILAVCAVLSSSQPDSVPWISLEYSIEEQLPPDSVVADIAKDSKLSVEAQDLQFSILEKDNLHHVYFSIEVTTGVLKIAQDIDRDSLCGNNAKCDLLLDIAAVGSDRNFHYIKVTIHIIDINDNTPAFLPSNVIEIKIPESTLPGKTFSIQKATDPDYGIFSIQMYFLQPSISASKFDLTTKRDKLDSIIGISLTLISTLDREKEEHYYLEVVAVDGGTPELSGTLTVHIIVQDENDHSPVFQKKSYEISIREDFPVNETIIQTVATDLDSGLNGELQYSLDTETYNSHGHIFAIRNTTGDIYLIQSLDYSDGDSYKLVIIARDRGLNSIPSTVRVTISIQDVNNHAPGIRVNPFTASGQVEVRENSNIGTFVAHLDINDVDKGVNGEFTCVLIDSKFQLEQLHTTMYQIITAVKFDREVNEKYTTSIQCEDHGTPPLSSHKVISVHITDSNDNPPVFTQEKYFTRIRENNTINLPLLQVEASDRDMGDNARITYSTIQDDTKYLSIDANNGMVRANIALDYEFKQSYEWVILAIDNGNPPLTASATLNLTLIDINDSAPEFTQPVFYFATYENQAIGTDIGSISATDPDSSNDQIQFALDYIHAESTSFHINPHSGLITTRRVLDREYSALYTLVVVASNPGFEGLSSSVTVSIHVADVNDNAPMITYPNPNNHTLQLPITARQGFVFAKIHAEDPDSGLNSRLVFSIAKGDVENLFDIDPHTGVLSTTKPASAAQNDAQVLLISVTDQGTPPKAAVAEVTIVINKTITYTETHNGPPPSITHLNQNQVILVTLSMVTVFLVAVLVAAIIYVKRTDTGIKRTEPLNRVEVHHCDKLQPLTHSDNRADLSAEEMQEMPTVTQITSPSPALEMQLTQNHFHLHNNSNQYSGLEAQTFNGPTQMNLPKHQNTSFITFNNQYTSMENEDTTNLQVKIIII